MLAILPAGVDRFLLYPAKLLPSSANHADACQNTRMDTGLPTSSFVFWRWLELHGLDAQQRFAQLGLSKQDLQPHSKRISIDKLERIVAQAIADISNPAAGLRAAECWHPSDLGALGYAWLSSSTLRTGFRRLSRYIRIVGERAALKTGDTQLGLKVCMLQKRDDAALRAFFADVGLSLMIDMCRMNAGADLAPVEVCLQRGQPACVDDYRGFFGCPVHFAASEDSLTLAADDADAALPTSNKQLAGVHDQILTQQLALLDRDNIVARCKVVIMEQLTMGELSAASVANELHMSVRTLTRRLEAQGTQLQKILDETRRELAERYFADPARSLSEIAFLLGFSQQSSLTRASKRWFGLPPKAYRSAELGTHT